MNYLIGLNNDETPLHFHQNYEIIVCTKGAGTMQLAERHITFSEGDMVIVPPGTLHGSSDESGWERLYISGELQPFFYLSRPVAVCDNTEREGLLLAKLIYKNRYSGSEYLHVLISAFAHFLLNRMQPESTIARAVKDISDKIIQDFHDTSLHLNTLLQKSGYAEDYIRSQFKMATGKTPTEFLTQVRISHARYLIETYQHTLSLSEIAEKCGYVDYVYFSRKFKQATGESPTQYRDGKTPAPTPREQ